MRPLYDARIEDLCDGDFLRVECSISTSSIAPDACAPVFGALGNGHGTESPLPRSRSTGGRTTSCCCMPTERMPAIGGPLNNRRQLRGHHAASGADDLISSVQALIAAAGCRCFTVQGQVSCAAIAISLF